MRAIINLLAGFLSLSNSLFGGLFTFILAIFTVVAAFIFDFPAQALALIKYIGNTLMNSAIDLIAAKIVSLNIFDYTYSIFDSSASVITWINYFFPLAECLAFALFILTLSIAVLSVVLFVKLVFQLAPTGG